MAPIRPYSNWNMRHSQNHKQVEPYRKYFILCEGANTETWYFKRLIDLRKELCINSLIEVILCEKTEKDKDLSNPKKLVEFANKKKKEESLGFDAQRDKMVIVFDADIFESRSPGYEELIEEAQSTDNILAVTNPSFELFLLLHYEDSYQTDILPNYKEILANEKTGNQTCIYGLLLKRTGINSKKNSDIGKLAKKIDIAIEQERYLNQDIHQCKGKITSNIGAVIQQIRSEDERKLSN